VEATVYGGCVFSDGVSGDPILAGDGNIDDQINPRHSNQVQLPGGVTVRF
jgi:hypothetical protein